MHKQAAGGLTRRGKATRTAYLPGLDGVRALAVMAVLFYHFQVPGFVGGFLGVDIFFVLSGYLISSQLWARWSIRDIDLKQFWLGRIRRLFPAVLLLMACSGVAMAIAERDQLGSFFGDVGAAATYTSNWWYILHKRSYFEAAGRPPVLQHLWSLAVEEQFYVLWPLLVVLVWRKVPYHRGRRVVLTTVSALLGVLSALAMGLGSAMDNVPGMGDPSRWYFGTDSHSMGMLFGASLAFYRGGAGFGKLMPNLDRASMRATAVGSLALVGLLASISLIDEYSAPLYRYGFPIIALTTTVLVSVVARPGPLAKLFSFRFLRYIGQRSYGLYLWHWPIAAFTRPDLDVPFNGPRLWVLRLALTFFLAELSYQLVEQPVRKYGWRRPWSGVTWNIKLVRLAAIQLVVGVAIAMVLPARMDLDSAAGADTPTTPVKGPTPKATNGTTPPPVPKLTPEQVTPRKDLSVVIYGDSVAVGAQPAFLKFFGKVDNRAKVAEQAWKLLPDLTNASNAGNIKADIVVLHTGDNGLIDDGELKTALDSLKDVKQVIVVTPKVPRPWEARALRTLRTVSPNYANVSIADWHAYAKGKANLNWFVEDGIHLTPAGADAYVRLIMTCITIPAPPKPSTTAPDPSGTITGGVKPPTGGGRGGGGAPAPGAPGGGGNGGSGGGNGVNGSGIPPAVPTGSSQRY
ncbi:O-acetyltransferase OatA [Austwickia sp. TVS 96-490-7B]|uniref:acyltransferase family protein n=1 Tax=Austwickia sp. TVS 96-490-7B TaxID=2830843 RepID=UPI001C56258D|nr:acyltransferase family protein [Austwickia sp. TVS 96-490-7B]MBW3086561.1 O-acetyltransferase OatA [Austwickia sp. TVS 96-490-7B]